MLDTPLPLPEPSESALAFVLRHPTTELPGASSERRLEILVLAGDDIVEVRQVDGRTPIVLGANELDPTAPALIRVAGDGPRLERDARGWVLLPTFDMVGFVDRTDTDGLPERTPVRGETVLRPGERLVVEIGALIYVIAEVAKARRVPTTPVSFDAPLLSLLGFLGAGAGLFGYALGTVPPPPVTASVELHRDAVVLDLLRMRPPPEVPVRKAPAATGAHTGAEGRARAGHTRPHGAPGGHAPSAMRWLQGMEGVMKEIGTAELASGVTDGIRGLQGRPTGTGVGLNLRGEGPGGGGRTASVGYDRQSLHDAERLATGCSGAGCDGKREGSIRAVAEGGVVLGALDSADVDRVIKSHMASIRYCYQKELQSQPGLGGKVSVKFTIAADGTVSSATTRASTAMPAVEACLTARFLKMDFPKPRGGGVVVVSYPFLFSGG